MDPAFGGVAQLDHGHGVDDAVDLPVPGSREAGGGRGRRKSVDRGGAVPGGEVVAVGEPGDVADLDQQPRGAGIAGERYLLLVESRRNDGREGWPQDAFHVLAVGCAEDRVAKEVPGDRDA